MHVFDLVPFLRNVFNKERRFSIPRSFTPGSPISSFVFGATFAFGWTPCIGPLLGTILLLASSTATVLQGAVLLTIFSAGLAVPFLLLALGVGHAAVAVRKLSRVLPYISFIGGVFLLFLGILLLTDSMSIWLSWVYEVFRVFSYDRLLNYL
jgi:cytochrome c-type biogenesis protein